MSEYPPGPPAGAGQPYPPHQRPYPPHQRPYPPYPPAHGTPSVATTAGPRVEVVPGTAFGLAYATVQPTVSGQAVGSLVAGILSIFVAMVVGCFGVTGAQAGWGPVVGGAFAVLAAAFGAAAIGLGLFGVRQLAGSPGRLTGRGMAVAGISCGAVGLLCTAVAMVLALLI